MIINNEELSKDLEESASVLHIRLKITQKSTYDVRQDT
jgi:hypothetical protein